MTWYFLIHSFHQYIFHQKIPSFSKDRWIPKGATFISMPWWLWDNVDQSIPSCTSMEFLSFLWISMNNWESDIIIMEESIDPWNGSTKLTTILKPLFHATFTIKEFIAPSLWMPFIWDLPTYLLEYHMLTLQLKQDYCNFILAHL